MTGKFQSTQVLLACALLASCWTTESQTWSATRQVLDGQSDILGAIEVISDRKLPEQRGRMAQRSADAERQERESREREKVLGGLFTVEGVSTGGGLVGLAVLIARKLSTSKRDISRVRDELREMRSDDSSTRTSLH